MTNDDKLLTVKEVALVLRLSLTETYRLVQSKELTHFRVGPGKGAIRVLERDVDLFLEKRRIGFSAEAPKPVIHKPALKHIRK